MRNFDEIIGHRAALELLQRLLVTRRVPQALLFHGPEGVGKATVASIFAAAMLCEREAGAACRLCRSCGFVAAGNHPDLLEVSFIAKKADDGLKSAPDETRELRTQIVVAQIRQLSRIAAVSPRIGRRRVFVIDPADRMNSESQNALLKTLEEPPGGSLIVLVASRPHLLHSTVRSRSFSVGFSALRCAELAPLLERSGLGAEEARERAALAGGRPGLALSLDLGALRERRELLLRALELLAAGPNGLGALPAMVDAIDPQDEQRMTEAMELLQGLLRDAARAAAQPGDAGLLHADLSLRLARLGQRLGPPRAAELVAALDRLRGYLRFNTNKTMIAEAFLAAVAGGPDPTKP